MLHFIQRKLQPNKGQPLNDMSSKACNRPKARGEGSLFSPSSLWATQWMRGWLYDFLKVVFLNTGTDTHIHTCHIIIKCSSSLFLCRTLTSRTSRPAGVMGWLSALWCTPSFPPSLTTPLCCPPTAKTTLNWPLGLQSEWFLCICVPDMMIIMGFDQLQIYCNIDHVY